MLRDNRRLPARLQTQADPVLRVTGRLERGSPIQAGQIEIQCGMGRQLVAAAEGGNPLFIVVEFLAVICPAEPEETGEASA